MQLNQIEGISFSLLPLEAKAIFEMVTGEGHPPNSQGVKSFLVSLAMDEEKEEAEENSLSEAVRKILEVAERNPQVTEIAIKKGTQILGTLLGKLRG